MADSTITGLPPASALDGTEPFEVVQSAASKQSVISAIRTYLLGLANTWTAAQTNSQAVAATSTDGHILATTTAATVGAQKWSPRFRLQGRGWATSDSSSRVVDWIAEVQPVQGSTNPSSNFVISSSINGGAYTTQMTLNSGGQVDFPSGVTVTAGSHTSAATGQFRFSGRSNIKGPALGSISFVNENASETVNFYVGTTAILQQGLANAASPVAQTLQAQGSRSGTDTDVGGANYTIRSGAGTGTGTVSSLILQSPVAVASGTGAQTQTTGLTIKAGVAVMTNYTVTNLPAAATAGKGAIAYVTDATATTPRSTVAGGGANEVMVMSNATNWLIVA